MSLLRKVFYLLAVIFIYLTSPVHAQSNFFNDLRPGQYVYYTQTIPNFSLNKLFGIMKVSQTDYFVRIIDYSSGKTSAFLGTFKSPGDFEITKIYSSDDKFQITLQIADFLNIIDGFYNVSKDVKFDNVTDITVQNIDFIHYDDAIFNISFSKYIPYYHIVKMIHQKTKKEYFKLHSFGFNKSSEVKSFFSVPISFQPKNVSKIKLTNQARKNVNIFDYSIPVDSNWSKESLGNTDVLLIKQETARDAIIMIEKISKEDRPQLSSENLIHVLINFQPCVIADSITIKKNGSITDVYYEVWSYELNRITIAKTKIIENDNDFYTITLNSFKDVYTNNKKYFDDIYRGINKIK